MSSFYCPICSTLCTDSESGMVSGCEHCPPELRANERHGRIATNNRSQFESWLLARLGDGLNWTMTVTEQMKDDREIVGLHCNSVGDYVTPAVQLAWEAWQQSQQTANNPPADSQRPTTHAQGHAR